MFPGPLASSATKVLPLVLPTQEFLLECFHFQSMRVTCRMLFSFLQIRRQEQHSLPAGIPFLDPSEPCGNVEIWNHHNRVNKPFVGQPHFLRPYSTQAAPKSGQQSFQLRSNYLILELPRHFWLFWPPLLMFGGLKYLS